MKLSLIASMSVFAIVLTTGCFHSPVVYSRTPDGTDWLVKESSRDNIDDYNELHAKAQEMCDKDGFKGPINVIDAHPSNPVRENSVGGYTLAYQCRKPGVMDQVLTVYKQVEKAVKVQ